MELNNSILLYLWQNIAMPPFNCLILLLIGLAVLRQSVKIATSIIVIATILLYVQATPFFVYSLARLIEEPPISQEQLQSVNAIVVVGGGTRTNNYEYNTHLEPTNYTVMRLRYASYLAKRYPNKMIILSGGLANSKHNSEADVMKRVLQRDFHVTNPIIIENRSKNTRENAQYVAQILNRLKIYDVAVISQAFHVRRVVALFKKNGIHAVAAPTDYVGSYDLTHTPLTLAFFLPKANTMHVCSQLLHEIFGYIIYAKN